MPRGEPACIHHDTVPLRRSPLPSQSTSDSALDTFSTQEGHTLDGRRPSGSDQPVWAASASSYAGESNKHSVRRDDAQIVSKRLCRSPSTMAQQIRISTPTSASTNMTGDAAVVIKREAQVITIPYDNGLGDRLSPVRVKFATDEQDFISVGSKFNDDLSRLANPGDPAFPELEGGSRKVSFRMIFRDIPPSETECKQKRIPGNVTRLQLARSAGKAVAAILQRPAIRSTSIKREEDAIEDDKERLGITERKSGSVKPECSYDTENVVLVSAEFVSRGSIDLVLGIYEKEHLHIHKQEPIELIIRWTTDIHKGPNTCLDIPQPDIDRFWHVQNNILSLALVFRARRTEDPRQFGCFQPASFYSSRFIMDYYGVYRVAQGIELLKPPCTAFHIFILKPKKSHLRYDVDKRGVKKISTHLLTQESWKKVQCFVNPRLANAAMSNSIHPIVP
ncbi:hypothetical protein IEO21_07927 [Rhodonia placenta]|uniref:Uncharacterized protein n=1 Tax=Rhodonia placenta TaxID=104341 RepID=A0A8H7NXE0_9APHY|nr:hypothetical protein IEO21_07927 [Postia placenta]